MYGYKALVWDPTSGSAISPIGFTVWQTARTRAICSFSDYNEGGPSTSHPAPDEQCSCGIYAAGMFLWLMDYVGGIRTSLQMQRAFTALLVAGGKVIELNMGWRAAEAEILAVSVAPTIMDKLSPRAAIEAAEAFGIPFEPSPLSLGGIAIEHQTAQLDGASRHPEDATPAPRMPWSRMGQPLSSKRRV